MASSAASPHPATAPFSDLPPESVIFGRSEQMRRLQQKAVRVATTDVPILIQGESGTGKEVLARFIHQLSPWRNGPFVKVSCAAIPGTLLESELFGYQKGAFTGAYNSKPGWGELANHGTLLLDEMGELDTALQGKLLQLLQDGQFSRIGGQEDRRVEARIICATNRRLGEEIAAGTFRQDLFYRINVITMELPPLRQRSEDIPILAEYLLHYYNERFHKNALPLSKERQQLLTHRRWVGNIRELENAIARYVILGSEEVLYSEAPEKSAALVAFESGEEESIPLKRMTQQAIREMESNVILQVLQANHWNRRKAAKVLNISYRALLYKIRQAGLLPRRTFKKTLAEANPLPPGD